MEFITTKEASAKWGISPTRITILANEGRIPGAQLWEEAGYFTVLMIFIQSLEHYGMQEFVVLD